MSSPQDSTAHDQRRDSDLEVLQSATIQNRALLTYSDTHVDILFHFGFNTADDDFVSRFGDTRFVLMGGSPDRMKLAAQLVAAKLGLREPGSSIRDPTGTLPLEISNIARSGRYSLFKAGPVICVNHNIGSSPLSVVLHEVMKLLFYAKVKNSDVHFIRLGTSGGIGIEPGTVVVSDKAVNSEMQESFRSVECGQVKMLPCHLDYQAATMIKAIADNGYGNGYARGTMPCVLGGTMGTDDFYLGQGRIDGALCSYTLEDKFRFLRKLHDLGVRNIEMEAHILSAFTHRAGIKCSIVCVTIVNRLVDDVIKASEETLKDWERRPCYLVSEFVKQAYEKYLLSTGQSVQ